MPRENWRRERDSNPRYPFGYNGFQDRRHQPLGHPSATGPPSVPGTLTPSAVPTYRFPPFAIDAFGHVVPLVETAIGLMLIFGLFTRPALMVGGLLITSLTFGTMYLQNFDLAWLQLTYAIAFFLLLATRSWNVISLDAMLFPSKGGR